jgi:hypothetical protein
VTSGDTIYITEAEETFHLTSAIVTEAEEGVTDTDSEIGRHKSEKGKGLRPLGLRKREEKVEVASVRGISANSSDPLPPAPDLDPLPTNTGLPLPSPPP